MTVPILGVRTPGQRIQGSLLLIAALFVVLFAAALTLSPAARLRSWQVDYRWSHWAAVAVWIFSFAAAHRATIRFLPNRDPVLLPLAGLLTGWGLLTIFRLTTTFGLRQTLWLALGTGVLLLGLRRPGILNGIRRFKYVWLAAGLALTALTLVLGTNPLGFGPRLWLGCCGVYLQPSEPLKLLLIIYLAAYLADRQPFTPHLIPLLAPTVLVTGIALALLLIQRDLGTASLFVMTYTAIIFAATGKKRILFTSALSLSGSGIAGYLLFDLVAIRMEAWINPWLDPSGRSYQIVQSLIALAAGGLLGRGPGLGSPGLVPVSHSDFIFSSIAEEFGLVGVFVLFILLAMMTLRGLRIALSAASLYHRYLATGITAYFAIQSIFIIGGNIRLLPLTGVTLPFISYGGSSLLTSMIALLLLLHISNHSASSPALHRESRPILTLGAIFFVGFGLAALTASWWSLWRGPDLSTRNDNVRRAIADLYVPRGRLLDRNDQPLHANTGEVGTYLRNYLLPDSGAVLGFNDPVFGQAGAEAGFDPILRGLVYHSPQTLWLSHLLYGQPPFGLDIRLSLDKDLQQRAQTALSNTPGAIVILNSRTGELLAIASNPSFDANTIAETGDSLGADPTSPLFNRATQGLYQPGGLLGPLLLTATRDADVLPEAPSALEITIQGQTFTCSRNTFSENPSWEEAIAAACPGALAELGLALQGDGFLDIVTQLGLYENLALELSTASLTAPIQIAAPGAAASGQGELRATPLQLARALSTISERGHLPSLQLALAVQHPDGQWLAYAESAAPIQVLGGIPSDQTAAALSTATGEYWSLAAPALNGPDSPLSWFVIATLSDSDSPMLVLVLLESDSLAFAEFIGRDLFESAP
ncbi:MAG: hypothetical protein EPO32_02565 [Anaerolineae bacterium]|nr:MAG: hypothetical protein EPO32_02565 [Anaerolineae bacterium]